MLAVNASCALFAATPLRAPSACSGGATEFPAWQTAVGLGVSAYLDCGGLGSDATSAARTVGTMDVSAVLDACMATAASPASMGFAPHVAALAAAALATAHTALPLAVYEGGPGLVEASAIASGSETPGLTALFIAANRHPRMETAYRLFLDNAAPALGLEGGRAHALPFCHYASTVYPSRYGSWGIYEYTGASLTVSPKARAMVSFVDALVRNLTRAGCGNALAVNYDPAAPIHDPSLCVFAPVALARGVAGAIVFSGTPLALTVPAGATTAALDFTLTPISPAALDVFAGLLGSGVAGRGSSWAALATATNNTGEGSSSSSSETSAAALLGPRAVATEVWRLGPPGTVFATAVTVCITLPADGGGGPAGVNISAADGVLWLYWSPDGRHNWTAASWGNATSTSNGVLCGELAHFTYVAGFFVPHTTLQDDLALATDAGSGGNSNGGGGGGGGGSGSPPPSTVADNAALSTAAIGGIAAAGAVLLLGVTVLAAMRLHKKRARNDGSASDNGKRKHQARCASWRLPCSPCSAAACKISPSGSSEAAAAAAAVGDSTGVPTKVAAEGGALPLDLRRRTSHLALRVLTPKPDGGSSPSGGWGGAPPPAL